MFRCVRVNLLYGEQSNKPICIAVSRLILLKIRRTLVPFLEERVCFWEFINWFLLEVSSQFLYFIRKNLSDDVWKRPSSMNYSQLVFFMAVRLKFQYFHSSFLHYFILPWTITSVLTWCLSVGFGHWRDPIFPSDHQTLPIKQALPVTMTFQSAWNFIEWKLAVLRHGCKSKFNLGTAIIGCTDSNIA